MKPYLCRHYAIPSATAKRHKFEMTGLPSMFPRSRTRYFLGETPSQLVLLVYGSRYYFIVCVEIDNAPGMTIYFLSVIRDSSSDKSQHARSFSRVSPPFFLYLSRFAYLSCRIFFPLSRRARRLIMQERSPRELLKKFKGGDHPEPCKRR